MNGFAAFCLWSFLICFASFIGGAYCQKGAFADICAIEGEFIARNQVISCKPVALIYEDKRIPLKE